VKSIVLAFVATVSLSIAGAGCSAGDGEGLDTSGRPLNESGNSPAPPTGAVAPDYNDIQAKVFTPTCAVSGCHSGTSAPLGLRLDADAAFDLLVNQPSAQQSQFMRVAPGDPDNSYLVQKLEGTAAGGVQMPRNQPPLSVATIQAIRDWIANGALGPRLSSIQETVFTPVCTVCHFGPSPAGGMSLEAGLSHPSLVGVKRPFNDEIRVVAGDASNSFIIDKLEDNNLGNSRGDRMPLGGPFLPQSTIDVVRQWIDDGAQDN